MSAEKNLDQQAFRLEKKKIIITDDDYEDLFNKDDMKDHPKGLSDFKNIALSAQHDIAFRLNTISPYRLNTIVK